MLQALAVAGHFPAGDFDAPYNEFKLKELAKDFSLAAKIASTCYYCPNDIPLHHVTSIALRNEDNQYVEISVNDFKALAK
jgi:hypothetical protein